MPYAPEYAGGGYVPSRTYGKDADYYYPSMVAAGGGALGAGLGSLFSDYKNPASQASPYLSEIQKMLPQYFQPYINAGQQALPSLQGAYSSMMNPNELMQKIGSGYQESPGFKFQRDQALKAMQNAQSAGGMLGSPQHEQMAGTLATNLANQDFYNYLKNALGLYGQGVEGERGLYTGGAQASMGLGQDLASILGSQAGLAYQGQQERNKYEGDTMGSIFGGLGSLLPFLLM